MADAERIRSCGEASTSASSTPADAEEYVQQKYGSSASHVSLTKAQVEGMLDEVLANSSPVQYLLESLKMVGH